MDSTDFKSNSLDNLDKIPNSSFKNFSFSSSSSSSSSKNNLIIKSLVKSTLLTFKSRDVSLTSSFLDNKSFLNSSSTSISSSKAGSINSSFSSLIS